MGNVHAQLIHKLEKADHQVFFFIIDLKLVFMNISKVCLHIFSKSYSKDQFKISPRLNFNPWWEAATEDYPKSSRHT